MWITPLRGLVVLRKPQGWHDWLYVGGRWHTLQSRLYYGTGSEATHSQAGAVVQHAHIHHSFMHACANIHTVWCWLHSNISLILYPSRRFFFCCYPPLTHFLVHTPFHSHIPLSHLFATLLLPRDCTVTSASWCSSLRRPMGTCSAGWHWVRSWTALRRSPPPRNLMRRKRPNSPDPGGTGQSVARNGLNDILLS